MSKHTPGPWKLFYAKESAKLPYEIFADHSLEFKQRPIATVDSNGPNGEHYDANASLIAAAPEMLEALRRARQVLINESAAENQPQLIGALNQISAAIAKAEGKS